MLRGIARSVAQVCVQVFARSEGARRGLLWAAYRNELLAFQNKHHAVECVAGAEYTDRNAFYTRLFEVAELNGPLDYLEFGVYKGASIAWWSRANKVPSSRFVGFDSFEGLPETVNSYWTKGQFSVGKTVPQIEDSRVSFEVGWFNHTIPPFMRAFERRHRLLINLDADIYSSTTLALAHLGGFLRAGDILIFDEFADTVNEWRAFCDFNAVFGIETRPILQQREWMIVAFVVV